MWRKGGEISPVYFTAVLGARNSRLAALKRLVGLIEENNPDIHCGEWDPGEMARTPGGMQRAKTEAKAAERFRERQMRQVKIKEALASFKKHSTAGVSDTPTSAIEVEREMQVQIGVADGVLAVRWSLLGPRQTITLGLQTYPYL